MHHCFPLQPLRQFEKRIIRYQYYCQCFATILVPYTTFIFKKVVLRVTSNFKEGAHFKNVSAKYPAKIFPCISRWEKDDLYTVTYKKSEIALISFTILVYHFAAAYPGEWYGAHVGAPCTRLNITACTQPLSRAWAKPQNSGIAIYTKKR